MLLRRLVLASAPKLADYDHLPSLEASPLSSKTAGEADSPASVLFVGNLVARDNVTSAHWCATYLRAPLPPEISVLLAGPGSDRLVAALGTLRG